MFPSHLSLISLNFYFSFCSFRWCFRFSCSMFYECFSAHPSLSTHTISRLFLCRFTWLHWLKRCISGWNMLDKIDTLKKNNQIKTTIKLKEIEKNKSPNSDTRDILLTSSSTTPPPPSFCRSSLFNEQLYRFNEMKICNGKMLFDLCVYFYILMRDERRFYCMSPCSFLWRQHHIILK